MHFAKIPYGLKARYHELTHAQITVFTYLCLCQNSEGKCWPSYTELEHGNQLSRQSVATAIKRLVEVGLVHVEQTFRAGGKRGSNIYTILFNSQATDEINSQVSSQINSQVSSQINSQVEKFDSQVDSQATSTVNREYLDNKITKRESDILGYIQDVCKELNHPRSYAHIIFGKLQGKKWVVDGRDITESKQLLHAEVIKLAGYIATDNIGKRVPEVVHVPKNRRTSL